MNYEHNKQLQVTKKGAVGSIGKKIPIIPNPKKMVPIIISIYLNVLFDIISV